MNGGGGCMGLFMFIFMLLFVWVGGGGSFCFSCGGLINDGGLFVNRVCG